jgi:hypothetical protein
VRTSWLPAIRAACAVLLFAVALRWAWFGDRIAGLDEQFYLLAGDRLHRGVLPYVDFWNRKAAGLFLLYAAARFFPATASWFIRSSRRSYLGADALERPSAQILRETLTRAPAAIITVAGRALP